MVLWTSGRTTVLAVGLALSLGLTAAGQAESADVGFTGQLADGAAVGEIVATPAGGRHYRGYRYGPRYGHRRAYRQGRRHVRRGYRQGYREGYRHGRVYNYGYVAPRVYVPKPHVYVQPGFGVYGPGFGFGFTYY